MCECLASIVLGGLSGIGEGVVLPLHLFVYVSQHAVVYCGERLVAILGICCLCFKHSYRPWYGVSADACQRVDASHLSLQQVAVAFLLCRRSGNSFQHVDL